MANLKLNKQYSLLIENTIKNAKLTGNIRRTSWIYNRALKGFFKEVEKGNEIEARNFANHLDSMITVLNSMYGENWDFNLNPYYTDYGFKGFILSTIIHYPEITIRNSEEKEHNIKDLIVHFNISESGFENNEGLKVYSPMDIKGTRFSTTYEEWFVGYRHSHLPSNKPKRFSDCLYLSDFCLGDGTEIRDILESMYVDFQSEMFEMFLHTINSIVEWESLEGVPYIKISSISIGHEENRVSNYRNYELQDFYTPLRDKISNLDVDFVYSENRYKIKSNNKFHDFIHSIIVNSLQSYWKRLLVTKVNSTYYGYSHPDIETEEQLKSKFKKDGENPYFYLRNRKLIFNVEPYTGELPDVSNYKVHPKFLEYVSTRLEQELYEKSVRKYTVEKHYQSVNA